MPGTASKNQADGVAQIPIDEPDNRGGQHDASRSVFESGGLNLCGGGRYGSITPLGHKPMADS
jgi:hypothetical protein